MNFDVLFCVSMIKKSQSFEFAHINWNIAGSKNTADLRLTKSDEPLKMEIQSQLFGQMYERGYLVFNSNLYNFMDPGLIQIDNCYRILSTISFDWNYKILLFVLLKMTKINFSNTINEIKNIEGGSEICSKLQRLLDYYNNSDLNVADSDSQNLD